MAKGGAQRDRIHHHNISHANVRFLFCARASVRAKQAADMSVGNNLVGDQMEGEGQHLFTRTTTCILFYRTARTRAHAHFLHCYAHRTAHAPRCAPSHRTRALTTSHPATAPPLALHARAPYARLRTHTRHHTCRTHCTRTRLRLPLRLYHVSTNALWPYRTHEGREGGVAERAAVCGGIRAAGGRCSSLL